MRKQDLFRLCLQNLLRKRSRTFLTVLGVVIGGCSIVIMVSLGIGMKEAQDKLLAELGDLTIITVTAPQGGRGKVKLDDAMVARLKKLDGAVAVMPRQTIDLPDLHLYAGSARRYVADWVTVTGLDTAGMEAMGFKLEKGERPLKPGEVVLDVEHMTVASKVHKNNTVKDVSLKVRRGEIVCIAGIDGNGQTEFVYGLTGLEPLASGRITLCGQDITKMSIRKRNVLGMSHIPEDRHKHGLVLDYSLEDNLVLERYFEPEFTDKAGFLRRDNIRKYAEKLIDQYDVRSGQGPVTIARSMSGGNQQKAIVAREIDKDPELLVAVQPTRGLDVGAIEYIHKQLVAQRDAGKAVLLVSLELDEVMDVPDRILVMYEGEIVGELDPKTTTQEELGLYMAGAKRDEVTA